MASRRLGILLLSGSHERVHYAFLLAAGAAAIGRDVFIFASNAGCRALLLDVAALTLDPREARTLAAGVAGLVELRDACIELGVRMSVCEAGMRIEGIAADAFLPGVEPRGVTSFLSDMGEGQVVSL